MKKFIHNCLVCLLDWRAGWGDKPAKPFDVWLFKMIMKLESE